ncbi:MAG TPA: flagellar basal body L-ring protein FlgH [Pirellulaceae bacterium]|jgi:flagellar L-ring protein precursor FlgH|nr:flagellar basal body L-ring protein FlgH [Pirellulaceae bacterium]
MNLLSSLARYAGAAAFLVAPFSAATFASAQDSSLFQAPIANGAEKPMTMRQASWFPSEVPQPRVIQEHDIISVRVQEGAQYFSEGEAERRKSANYQAILLEWLTLNGLGSASPNPQQNGDPEISGRLNSQYRAESGVESQESLAFNLAAEVIGIRPNGNVVIEARRMIEVNDDVSEFYLSGECRQQDIGVGNLVLSKDILNLMVKKTERGGVRDGYRRGWLQKGFDAVNPF